MLTAGVVAIGLLLGSRGEAPREEKFLGALLAQADVAPLTVNDEARQREIDELLRKRPTLRAAATVLGIGGGVATLGGVAVLVGVTGGSIGGILLAALGLIVGVAGLVVALVGLIMMIGNAAAQGDVDARIQELRDRPSSPTPSEPPPSPIPPPAVMLENKSTVVLARF